LNSLVSLFGLEQWYFYTHPSGLNTPYPSWKRFNMFESSSRTTSRFLCWTISARLRSYRLYPKCWGIRQSFICRRPDEWMNEWFMKHHISKHPIKLKELDCRAAIKILLHLPHRLSIFIFNSNDATGSLGNRPQA